MTTDESECENDAMGSLSEDERENAHAYNELVALTGRPPRPLPLPTPLEREILTVKRTNRRLQRANVARLAADMSCESGSPGSEI
jgi:hypothetical protein